MPRSTQITINGLKTHVNFWGNSKNPKLFLFHGWMDMGASFEFLCQYLKKDFYCIAPDLRGFGQSGHKKDMGYFFYEYVSDAHEIFRKYSPDEPVNVLGHSMGGNIISLYAGAMSHRVKAFINVEGFGIHDMSPEQGPERMRDWLEGEAHPFRVYPKLSEIADRLMKTNPRLEKKKALFLARHLSRKVRAGYQIAADPRHKLKNPYLFQMKNILPFWKNIKARCVNVVAEKTEMGSWIKTEKDIHREIELRLKEFPPHSQRAFIADCGHMIHHEKPGVLASVVRNFLGNKEDQ